MSVKPCAKTPRKAFKSLITILLSVGILSGCSSPKGKLGELAELAPSNSFFIVAFDGLDVMVKQAGDVIGDLGQYAAFLPPEAGNAITLGLMAAQNTLGFDPTVASAYAEIGLDLSRPLGMIGMLDMGTGEPTGWVAVPVSDRKEFNAFIGRMAGSGIQELTAAKQTIYYTKGARGSCWAYKNNYLLGGDGRTPVDCGQSLAGVLNSDSTLHKSKSFKKMNSAMGKDWSLVAWLGMEGMLPQLALNDPQSANMLNLLGIQSAAVNLSGKDSSFGINYAVQFDEDSRTLEYLNTINVSQKDALSEQLSGSPIAVTRMRIDAPGLLEFARSMPDLQEDLMEMSRDLAGEGMTIDQVAGLVPTSIGGALFFEAAGLESWVGGGVNADSTALTAQITRACGQERRATLQPLANGVACLKERRGEIEGVLTSGNIAAIVFGEAMGEPSMLQAGIIRRVMGLGSDADGYGEEGLSSAASKALNAKGLATAYLDVPAALKALSTNPEFVREAGPMGVMGLGMAANAIKEGMTARLWLDDDILKANASISLEGLGLEGGSTVMVTMGILAGIAIPNFVEMQYKAKRAEVPSNVKAIKEALLIYGAENDRFLAVRSHPSYSAPGKSAQDWGTSSSGFNMLNWQPDGRVRGVYSVTTTPPSSSSPGGDFMVIGRCDVDGDGVEATFTATKSINTRMTTRNHTY
jgi:type II secretory pathway pseudopilin PulG